MRTWPRGPCRRERAVRARAGPAGSAESCARDHHRAGSHGLTARWSSPSAASPSRSLERSAQLGAPACSWFAGACWRRGVSWRAAIHDRAPRLRRASPGGQGASPAPSSRHAGGGTWPRRGGSTQFAGRHRTFLSPSGLKTFGLEPDLAGRFSQGLYFRDEGHLDRGRHSRRSAARLGTRDCHPLGVEGSATMLTGRRVIDCTVARGAPAAHGSGGVKGEMLLLRCRRCRCAARCAWLHPRVPVVCRAAAGWALHGGPPP